MRQNSSEAGLTATNQRGAPIAAIVIARKELMLLSLVFWACFSGSAFLLIGLVLIRRELTPALGLNKVIVLGYVFVAAPLAVFGTEHLLAPRSLMDLVPSWIPAPLFWTYFVGIALFAAALSLIVRKHLRWSALLLALMFFIFALSMDVPGVIAHAKERLSWTLMLRETAFAGGALALAGAARQDSVRISSALIAIGRVCVAVPLIFFSIEHFAFAKFAPGVPLEKLSPNWVPIPEFWAYAVGAVLFFAGVGMLFNWRTRIAAVSVGLVMTFLTVFLYFPIFVKAFGTPQALDELNYVGDTLLFGGTALLLGIAVTQSRQRSEID
jgi:uncharacterized membrane protein